MNYFDQVLTSNSSIKQSDPMLMRAPGTDEYEERTGSVSWGAFNK
jgi:hypothetical protein